MDDKTNQAPEQSGMPDNEEYSSYTLPTEDAAAQEAHTIPLEDAAAQESRTIPLEDEHTQGAQDSAAQPAKKKSPLPWIIGGAAVVIAAAITLILAGGIGNLIDRVARGFVVDMFEFDFISFPIFNFADVLICVGTGLLFIFILFFYEKYFPSKKKRTENKEAEKETVTNDADRA